jgi:hypothetical protein
MMLIPVLSATPSSWKPQLRHKTERTHLMLAGINQTVFLKQWGEPETQIGLNCLGSLNKLGSLFLIVNPSEEVHHSVWIYKKKDRILFFTRRRLTSHFKWSEFKEGSQRPKEWVSSGFTDKASSLMTTTLALVA